MIYELFEDVCNPWFRKDSSGKTQLDKSLSDVLFNVVGSHGTFPKPYMIPEVTSVRRTLRASLTQARKATVIFMGNVMKTSRQPPPRPDCTAPESVACGWCQAERRSGCLPPRKPQHHQPRPGDQALLMDVHLYLNYILYILYTSLLSSNCFCWPPSSSNHHHHHHHHHVTIIVILFAFFICLYSLYYHSGSSSSHIPTATAPRPVRPMRPKRTAGSSAWYRPGDPQARSAICHGKIHQF